MLVAVGTRNPTKLQGVANAFTDFFKDVEVKHVDTSSLTRAQPIDINQIIGGALDRARFALMHEDADFGVGVEAGLFAVVKESVYINQQYAAILDRRERLSLGSSIGFMLPRDLVDKLLTEGKELEYYATEITGVEKVGDKQGLIFHLTKGTVSRLNLTEQCVRAALIPWMNKPLYGVE